jgi:hypothetical protein
MQDYGYPFGSMLNYWRMNCSELFCMIDFSSKVLRYAIYQDRCTECSFFSGKASNQGVALCHGMGEWLCTDKVKLTSVLRRISY